MIINSSQWAKNNNIVDSLPLHQAESSLVTQRELALAGRWMRVVAPDEEDMDTNEVWLDNWLNTAIPFSFRYGGIESDKLLPQWQLSIGAQKEEGNQQEFVWIDQSTGLRLTWQVRRFADYPAVEWVLSFENTQANDTLVIEDIQALDLRLKHSRGDDCAYTVHGANGGRSVPDDMVCCSWQVPSFEGEKEIHLGGSHPSSNNHLPFFNLETPEDRGALVGVGWSGNWLGKARVEGSELHTQVGLKESHFILRHNECVRTPRILLVFWEGKRLHGHNMLRQVLHKHYVPPLRDELQQPLVSVNVCFTHHGHGGFLHQATEKEVLSLVEPFVKIGAELFIIDAGWYEGEPWPEWLGNWRFSKKKYPRGLRPISEQLAEANVPFGLWFAPENVSKTAPLLREHPEWVWQREPGAGGTLRMEIPEAREWLLKQIDELVENELMSCYRQDGSGWYGDEPDNRKGINESQHITGLYVLWDTLKKRHPDIIMEGCSGGGRRIDRETLSRFHWHQKSDRWYDSESDQCSLYGANLYLPGGVMNIPTEATDDYGAWSSFAGQFCLGWHPLDEDFPMELARRQVERYKRIRHLLSGDFYPLTPCSLSEPWLGYQFHHVDVDSGFALLFRRPNSEQTENTFKLHLRGLNPQSGFQVHFEGSNRSETLTGQKLAEGIEVSVNETPGAEMIIYEPTK